MFDQLFRSRYKRECDLADAQNLIERHGPAALAAAKERASDGRLSPVTDATGNESRAWLSASNAQSKAG